MKPAVAGELMLYVDQQKFSNCQLKIGNGNSASWFQKLKTAKAHAVGNDFAIIDGSPGIGCPVIASLSGVDMVLIVAEPSISGISDLERIIETAAIFVKLAVCINNMIQVWRTHKN